MASCAECGSSLKEGDKFCLNCGAELSAPASTSRTTTAELKGADLKQSETPWKLIAIIAISAAVLLAITVVIALISSKPPDEKIGRVSAPGFDSELAGGGLSSDQIGSGLLLSLVRSSEPVGFQILQDGVEENVIDDFKQIQPRAGWDSEFGINDLDLKLRFRNKNSFFLNYPRSEQDTADEILTIASRYGFLSEDSQADLKELDERTGDLISAVSVRLSDGSIAVGIPDPDLVSEAESLASDWDTWIGENPESDGTPVAKSSRDLVTAVGEIAASPSNGGVDEFKAALDRYRTAVHKLKEGK